MPLQYFLNHWGLPDKRAGAAYSGMTYERGAILKHLDSARQDPCTRTPLRRRHLSPNLALRGVIEAWVAAQCKRRWVAAKEALPHLCSSTLVYATNTVPQ